jgi:hypothetical protein
MVDVVNLDSTVRHIDTQPGTPTKDFFNWLKKISDFGAAWIAFTPTVTAGSGAIAAYTATCRYREIGRTVMIQVQITITNAGTAGGSINVTLPRAALGTQMISGRDVTSGSAMTGTIGGSNMAVVRYDSAFPGVTGSQLVLGGSYEEA